MHPLATPEAYRKENARSRTALAILKHRYMFTNNKNTRQALQISGYSIVHARSQEQVLAVP